VLKAVQTIFMVQLGPYTLPNRWFAAPMAGVTDRPFRTLCKTLGAGYAVSEMVTSNPLLWDSLKTSRRANHEGESSPIAVQIAGVDPEEMAQAAVYNVDRGAQIIDINMGCPAKKVCTKWAGSALMSTPDLALRIVGAVVDACAPRGVPVTLKMRTGRNEDERNALALAVAAQNLGVSMVTVHGRTREQGYKGQAEYETVAAVKRALTIPVVANGDIDSPHKAMDVLRTTGADAVMIGRAAQGRPWIFGDIDHFAATGTLRPAPLVSDVSAWLLKHLDDHHTLYGDLIGVRSARKHIGWALKHVHGGEDFRQQVNAIEDARTQWRAVAQWFADMALRHHRWPDNSPEHNASMAAANDESINAINSANAAGQALAVAAATTT
jgi:tRNA-dihydrouridine synthase B